MKCIYCGKQANIMILGPLGEVDETNVYCCWCFAKDFREHLNAQAKAKPNERRN